jgi:hypothetical protein
MGDYMIRHLSLALVASLFLSVPASAQVYPYSPTIIPVTQGGTGLASGSSGGIPYYSASGTMASSGALSANQLILGGGAGSAPTVLGALGTTTTLLHGNAAGAPTFGAVANADLTNSAIILNGTSVSLGGTRSLSLASADFANQGTTGTLLHGNAAGNPSFSAVAISDISGTMTATKGGTGTITYATGDLLYSSATNALSKLAFVSTATRYLANTGGAGTVEAWDQVNLTNGVSGTLPVASGGSGLATLPVHGVLLGEAAANIGNVAAMAVDTLLQGQGATTDPAAVSLTNCGSSSQALAYSTTTHAFSCQTITGTAALTATDIGYGSAGNVLTGTSDFTWVDSTRTLTLGGTAGATTIASGPQNGGSAGGFTVAAGANTFFATAGALVLQGSNGTGAGIGGGNTVITAGTSASSTAGSVLIQTAASSGGTLATRVTVDPNGNANFTGAIASGGTKFTASGCSNTTTVGGAIAGSFHSGATGACTVTITLPTSPAGNGWACYASDTTTPANLISQSGAISATACTITGTTVSGDVIVFSAMGY